MEISNKGLKFLLEEEGFRSCPYLDATGTWTRGVGETEGIGPNSRCISEQEGIENVKKIFNARYAPALRGMKLNQNQFDAMASFIWNCGPGAADWDVGRRIREGKYQQAANDLLQYVTSKGIVLPDLQRRRARERALFLTPIKDNPLNVLYPLERRVVDLYLSQLRHPKLHKKSIKKLKNEMKYMAGNIVDAAVKGEIKNHKKVKRGWDINNRRVRYSILNRYSV